MCTSSINSCSTFKYSSCKYSITKYAVGIMQTDVQ